MAAPAQQPTSVSSSPSLNGQLPPTDKLPDAIEAIRQAHILSAQSNAIVAALFAGAQAQLLSGIPNDGNAPKLTRALTLFSYAGLVLSIGASLSAMGLLDYLAEIPEQFWRSQAIRPKITPDTLQTDFQLLQSHEGSPKMHTAYVHCHISLILGAYCLILQIALLAWLKSESVAVFVVIIIVCLLSAIPTYPGQMVLAFLGGVVEGCSGKRT